MGTIVERPYRMLIGGQLVASSSGATIESVSPSSGQVVAAFPDGDESDVDLAVSSAEDAFDAWASLPPLERAASLNLAASQLLDAGPELSRLDTIDNGSPIREMRKDVAIAAAQLRYFAGLVLQLRGQSIPTYPGALDYTLVQPYGVVGRIVAFNHPLLFAASRIAAPLAAGNCVVLKPSELTSLTTLRLGELWQDTFPPGVLNFVSGTGSKVGVSLVAHPAVPRIGFTGSKTTGQSIQQHAARAGVKYVSLELGGKNPILVFPDADLEAAAEGIVRGMNFTWQGQSCGSTSRLIVHESVMSDLTKSIAARMQALRVGDPLDEETEVGAIASPSLYTRIMHYVDVGREDTDTELIIGGEHDASHLRAQTYIQPTFFVTENVQSPLWIDEIFGPVLVAKSFTEVDEAIQLANQTEYGLTASVWTRDLAIAHTAAEQIQAGYVWVNASSAHIPGAPFGGFKASGVDREEDLSELYSYAQVKNVYVKYSS